MPVGPVGIQKKKKKLSIRRWYKRKVMKRKIGEKENKKEAVDASQIY